MEFEQSMSMLITDIITGQKKINNSKHKHSHSSRSSPRSSSSQAQDHLDDDDDDIDDDDDDDDDVKVAQLESFQMPMSNDSSEKKLSWLRSQIIGGDVEFESPFGKRRLTYADHTASGRCLHYIENYIINNVLPFYGNSHSSDSYVGDRTTKMVHEASEYVKRCMGGGEDDALIFCGWGTTGAIKRLQEVMGIAIPSMMRDWVLKSLLKDEEETYRRWVVFVGPYEHHSNILSWRQSLAEVVEIGLIDDDDEEEDNGGLIDMEALRLQLVFYQSTKRPMLGSFSACSNVTGTCTDTRALARLLHQYGAFACFDFAASGPYVEIDMRSGEIDGYDGVFLSAHKFVGGPGSPGILLMSKQLYQLGTSPPSTCGGGTVNFVNGFNDKDTLYVDNIEEREDAGTPPIVGKIRAALAFWMKEYIGYQVMEKQEHDYIQKALGRLVPNHNIWILGNTTAKRQAILSFLIYSTIYSSSSSSSSPSSENVLQTNNINGKEEISSSSSNNSSKGLYMWRETGNKRDKPLHGSFVAKLLNDLFGIQARGGCACAGPYGHILLDVDQPHSLAFRSAIQMGYKGVKPGWTRISFPYYMSNEEFEFILAAMEFIAIYGQRFLPLYHLNWKTGAWTFKKRALRETLQVKEHNCNFHGSPMAMATAGGGGGVLVQRLNLGCYESKEHNNGDAKDQVGVIGKYASYLETAKSIASLLPKFPPQRRIPEDIDLDLLPFRV